MKNDIILAGLLATFISLVVPTTSQAQGMWTCTQTRDDCKARGFSGCDYSLQQCLKTGRWVGSQSNRDFGPRIKR